MTTAAFWAQHRNDADDRAGEPQQNMHAHQRQKDWIAGRYLDSRNVDGVGGHVASCDQDRS